MMDATGGKLILGLETGLDGGSISIFRAGKEIDFVKGAGGVSKSEDLLGLIEELLRKNGLRKKDILGVVVSDGPGSPTGIRIGLALARGLGAALSARVMNYSILQALAANCIKEGRLLAGLYSPKGGFYFREFLNLSDRIEIRGEVMNLKNIDDFFELIHDSGNSVTSLVLHEDLAEIVGFEKGKEIKKKIEFRTVNGNFGRIMIESFIAGRVR